jgi:hypothetical protein
MHKPSGQSYLPSDRGLTPHWQIEGGIGHNLPQEDPSAFAQAIIDLAKA